MSDDLPPAEPDAPPTDRATGDRTDAVTDDRTTGGGTDAPPTDRTTGDRTHAASTDRTTGDRTHAASTDRTTGGGTEAPPTDRTTDDIVDLDRIAADLDGVEAALQRLDSGTYWTDEVTGQPIADSVLDTDPVARRNPDPA